MFVARAAENGLEISKPIGDSGRFDCVIGGPGKMNFFRSYLEKGGRVTR